LQASVALVGVVLGSVGLATIAGPLHASRPTAPAGLPATASKAPAASTPGDRPTPADPAAPAFIGEPDRSQPDAFVFADPSGYYLYSSQFSITTPPIAVSYSQVLGQWPAPQPAMAVDPPWAAFGFTWAPDVSRIGRQYVLYFDALDPAELGQCVGVATSRSPLGPFLPTPAPLVCQPELHGAIDPRTFGDRTGGLWLLWKSDDNADFQGPTDVTHIFSQRLSRDGLSLLGPQFELLSADERWQHRIVEAPDLVEAAGSYWLFYSGGWFNQPYYAIGFARCSGPAGPCTEGSAAPWLTSNAQGQGPGEESLFDDRAGCTWMAYSPTAWLPQEHIRPLALARVAFTASGPELLQPTLPVDELASAWPFGDRPRPHAARCVDGASRVRPTMVDIIQSG
jgi:beta-xylosidase